MPFMLFFYAAGINLWVLVLTVADVVSVFDVISLSWQVLCVGKSA